MTTASNPLARLNRASHGLRLPAETSGVKHSSFSCRLFSPKGLQRSFPVLGGNRVVDLRATSELDFAVTPDVKTETLNWSKLWWPVQLVENLDTDRPNRIQLMGKFYAVWKSKSGEWIAMRDMCPHRLAPLSEGRIEDDGTLMCSYHGWRFNECGKCVKIPQADDAKAHEAACNNQRSTAKTFPCKVFGHLIWIWADDSDTNFAEADDTPLPFSEDHAAAFDERVKAGWGGFTAVVPYPYDVLMENLADPSHFPVAHHKTLLGTRDMAKPLRMRSVESHLPSALAAVEFDMYRGAPAPVGRFEITSPNTVVQQIGRPGTGSAWTRFVNFVVPVDSSRTRLFLLGYTSSGKQQKPPPLALRLFPWLLHLGNLRVLDGDNIILHQQGRHLRAMEKTRTRGTYCTPASSDLLVNKFRQWVATEGGGGPMGSNVELPVLSRKEILDRYKNHVAECKICQAGLRFVRRAAGVSKLFSQFCLLVAIPLLARSMQGALAYWQAALPLVAFSLFVFIEKQINEKLIPQFYFVDYVHAEID